MVYNIHFMDIILYFKALFYFYQENIDFLQKY